MNYKVMEMEILGNALDKRIGAEKMSISNDKITNIKREMVGDEIEMNDGVNLGGEEKTGTGYNREKPPEDDCCPICFGEFRVPCKANCGHWFCGSCILQLWEYRSRPGRCKCPFCSCPINKLGPEVSAINKTDDEVVEILENIVQYNQFYVEGMKGCFLILSFYLRKHGPRLHLYIWSLLRALVMAVVNTPACIKRVLVDPIRHPERIRLNFHRVRIITYTLSLLLHLSPAILLRGNPRLEISKIRLWIDLGSIILVFLPYMVILCNTWIHTWSLKLRIWQLRKEVNALRTHNAALREQEAALQAQVHALRAQEAALEENAVFFPDNAALQAETG